MPLNANQTNSITISVSDAALAGLNILLARENATLNQQDALPITLEELLSVSSERQGVAEYVRDGRANKQKIFDQIGTADEATLAALRQVLDKK